MKVNLRRELRLLRACAVVNLLLVTLVIGGAFRRAQQKPTFDEIDAGRINIVERDGTVRLVIANKARLPDPVVDGKTFPRSGIKSPGLIFYNDEGDENGGLIFATAREDGTITADSGLLFDQYKQDQTVGLVYTEEAGQRTAGLRVWDRPDVSASTIVDQVLAARQKPEPDRTKALDAMRTKGWLGRQRVFTGKQPDGSAAVTLSDGSGKPRLVMKVERDGAASIAFLDENGKLVRQLP